MTVTGDHLAPGRQLQVLLLLLLLLLPLLLLPGMIGRPGTPQLRLTTLAAPTESLSGTKVTSGRQSWRQTGGRVAVTVTKDEGPSTSRSRSQGHLASPTSHHTMRNTLGSSQPAPPPRKPSTTSAATAAAPSSGAAGSGSHPADQHTPAPPARRMPLAGPGATQDVPKAAAGQAVPGASGLTTTHQVAKRKLGEPVITDLSLDSPLHGSPGHTGEGPGEHLAKRPRPEEQ